MGLRTLAWTQLSIGILAIIVYFINAVTILPAGFHAEFLIQESLAFLFGCYAIATGSYNLQKK